MQRMSTIFDFMEILTTSLTQNPYYQKFNRLSDDLFYIEKFQGKSWNHFTRRIQLDFRRTKLQMTILLRETGSDAKFELFHRLNSGGTAISGQELRNAIMAGRNKDILYWFEQVSSYESFVKVCGLADRDLATRIDVELVLRFIVFLSPELVALPKAKSVDVFLTKALRNILDDDKFDFDYYKLLFKSTFDAILNAWGENALRYKTSPGSGKFSISFFEAVALGVAQNINTLSDSQTLKSRIDSIGDEQRFRTSSGSGKNAQRRIPELVELGRHYFKVA
jgi:hypothetical protein